MKQREHLLGIWKLSIIFCFRVLISARNRSWVPKW